MNVDEMSMEELDILQQQIMTKKINSFQERLERMESNQIKSETKNEIQYQELKNDVGRVTEIAIASSRVTSPQYDYVNQSDFGNYFNVSMSSQKVGKLLKLSGIAKRSRGKTLPYREHIPNLAKSRQGTSAKGYNYSTTVWHFNRCVKKIDEWLKDSGHFYDFYNIEYEKDLEIFIDELYKKYMN